MTSPLQVLHLEDNNIDAELIRETLAVHKVHCEITLTATREDFLQALINKRFDIILADFNLPSFDGFEALKLAKKYAPGIPFIFISGVLGEELAIETLKKGATDYVIKSRLERLAPAINRALKEREERVTRLKLERDLAELEQMISDLKSTYDELTKRVRGFLKIEIPELKYSIVDKFLADLSGYPISAWRQTPNFIAKIIHPDFQDYYLARIAEFRQGFVPKMLEYKIVKQDGEERWWLQFNIGAFDAQGRLTSVSAVIIDNTEDKENYIKYQNLFENALTGMFRTDVETGQIIEANSKMAELLGFDTVEELKSYPASFFYPHPEKRKELIEKLKANGYYEAEVIQIKRKDGSTIWIQESSRLYPDKGFVEGIFINITSQKLAEEALKRDHSVFQLVANAAVFANDIETFCKDIISGLTKIFQFDTGSFRLYDPETNLLVPCAATSIDPEAIKNLPTIPLTQEKHAGALVGRTKKPVFAPDISKHELIKDFVPLIKDYTVGANITWPIVNSKDELIAVLQLANQEPKEIQGEVKILFETISSMIASALERFQAEQALRDSEEKFRAYAEQSLIGVILLNNQGDLLFFNDEILRISGFEREEISHMKSREITAELFTEIDRERLRKQIRIVEEEGISQKEEYQIISKEGQKKWISLHLAPINFHDSQAISAIVLEITEQKRAQLTIERERQAFHIIASAALTSGDVFDLSRRVLTGLLDVLAFDFGIVRLFNQEKRQLEPAAYVIPAEISYEIQSIPVDDPKFFVNYVAKTKEAVYAPDINENQITIKFLDRLKVFNTKAVVCWPILNKESALLGIILIASTRPTEITEEDRFFFNIISNFFSLAIERRYSEDALRESQETFEKLINTSPLAIFHTDLQSGIRLVNKYALELLRVEKAEDLIGKEFQSFLIAPDQARLAQDIEILLKTGSFINYDYLMERSDKSVFPIELSASVILDNNQKPDSLLFIGNDVTVRKELERNLRNHFFEFEVMNKIISAGYRANNLNQFLDFVLDTVLNSLDFSGGLILLRSENNLFEINKSLGASKQLVSLIQQALSSETFLTPLIKKGATIIIDDLQVLSPDTPLKNIEMLIGIPFFSKKEIIGALILLLNKARSISATDQQLLESIGKDIGTAIAKFQAEQLIKERQIDLQSIFNILEEIIFVIDHKSGLILEVNDIATRKLGYIKRQLQSMRFLDLLSKEYWADFQTFLAKAKPRTSGTFTFEIKTKGQETLMMNVTLYYQRYLSHEAIFAILRDA
ncbi:MAG: PAS domain S-box protein [Candidatus Heimdallarchaeota archaeon]